MVSENLQELNQMEFSIKDRAKAEFWAWLCEGYPVSANTGKSMKDRKLIVISKDSIKTAIREALIHNDSIKAQELLDIASKPDEDLSNSTVRKSIRVSPGEYVKLLFLKMKEKTSFADVMMKVLHKPCKKIVEELKIEFLEKKLPTTRLDHLANVIDSWEQEKPESRSDVALWGDWVKSSYRMSQQGRKTGPVAASEWDANEMAINVEKKSYVNITPFYSKSVVDKKFVSDLKETFSRFAMTDLTLKAAGGDFSKPTNKLFYEFKNEWLQKLETTPLLEKISFSAFIDNSSEKQELFCEMYFQLDTWVSAERELDLFSKYNEEEVKEFIERLKMCEYPDYAVNGRFNGITNAERYKEWVAGAPSDHDDDVPGFGVQIGTELDLVCCVITVSDPRSYQVDWPDIPIILDQHRRAFESLLSEIADKVGFERIHKDDSRYPTLVTTAGQLIPKALENANSPEDFRAINNLLMLKNLFTDYMKIIEFGEQVITSTLKQRSVVSLYINIDLWRMIPLVLEQKNWTTLVEEYLNDLKNTKKD
jgi:predicted CopG family antitoxin